MYILLLELLIDVKGGGKKSRNMMVSIKVEFSLILYDMFMKYT